MNATVRRVIPRPPIAGNGSKATFVVTPYGQVELLEARQPGVAIEGVLANSELQGGSYPKNVRANFRVAENSPRDLAVALQYRKQRWRE